MVYPTYIRAFMKQTYSLVIDVQTFNFNSIIAILVINIH